jgi:putative toxin-antitoxin system antitoxin component (TIGR02293 family)
VKKYKKAITEISNAEEPSPNYGVFPINNDYAIINKIETGISYNYFNSIVQKSPFTLLEWSNFLHLTDRTLLRYKSENKSFENIYAEKIIELDQLIQKGLDTFNDIAKFKRWLHSQIMALGGRKPIDLLTTSLGIDLIKNELVKIDYGVLA